LVFGCGTKIIKKQIGKYYLLSKHGAGVDFLEQYWLGTIYAKVKYDNCL